MSVTKEQIGDLNWMLKIKLESQDYLPQFEKSLKEYSKKIDLKGFRKGKVPKGVVKKMYGREILAEELNKLVGEELNEYMEKEGIKILGEPLPDINDDDQTLDAQTNKPYEFRFEIGLQPEFSLDFLEEKPSITRYEINVDKELVDKEIENIQRRYGKVSQADKIESDEDVVKVHLQELTKEGEAKEDGIHNHPAIGVEVFKKKPKEALKELAIEGSMDIDLKKDLDKDYDEVLTEILEARESPPESTSFRLTLQEINHTEKAEVNQELFDKVYGEGNIEDEKEFRDKVAEELDQVLDNYEEQQLQRDITDHIMEKVEVKFPEDFLKRWLKSSEQEEVTEDNFEEKFPTFLDGLKWNLIKNRLLKEADIQISEEDIMERTRQLIRAEYKIPGDDEQTRMLVDQLAGKMMEDKSHVNRVIEMIEENHAFEQLKTKFEIKEKAVSFDQFKEIIKKNQA